MSEIVEQNAFVIFATGTIESATFPLGPESSQIFCRFEIVSGSNWELVSGITSGISQAAMPKYSKDKIVFNIPFECIYKSTNPFGWPQLLISVYGKNRWSVETTLGYCWSHLPIIGSNVEKTTKPICIPKDTTVMGELSSWITSRNAELKNPKIVLDAYEHKELLSMEKNGEIKLSLRTLFRGSNDFSCERVEKLNT